MNETRREGKAHGNCLISFEPFPAIQADCAHCFECASFFLDNGSPLS
jgi:hypothetical protein